MKSPHKKHKKAASNKSNVFGTAKNMVASFIVQAKPSGQHATSGKIMISTTEGVQEIPAVIFTWEHAMMLAD